MSEPSVVSSSPLLRFLHRNVPGVAFLRGGHRTFGYLLLGYFLCFPVIIFNTFSEFLRAYESMAISLYLLAVDTAHLVVFWRGDIIEHWVGALFLIAMPVVLWALNRRYLRRKALEGDEHELSQWALAWREFKKNRIAAAGMLVIIALYTEVFLCPFLAPFHPNAFQDGIVTKYRAPLSSVTVLHLKNDRVEGMEMSALQVNPAHAGAIRKLISLNRELTDEGFSRQQAVDAYRIEGANVMATVGNELVVLPIAKLVDSEPDKFASERFYILGTDSYGRDILSRIIYGSRVSLTLGFIAVLLSVTLGTFVGLTAGYFGRITDTVLMRTVDMLLAFPALFLILIIIAAFESVTVPRIVLIVVVLGLTSWMGISRLVRGEVLSLKEREYVLAARALGFTHHRIILRHILPNTLTPIIVNATLRIGGIILVEAALSYLNIGVQPPTASWGNIIFEGKDVLAQAWWISTLPGFAIVIVVVCFNLVGDGLRDAFDPMLNNERL
ncbi:MAG: ABC transporter permease [Bacteroidetes bacterium]|nr:ABC transporter permease [Bacteroidota bacterium]